MSLSPLQEVLASMEDLADQYKGFEATKRAEALKATIAADIHQHTWLSISNRVDKLREIIAAGKAPTPMKPDAPAFELFARLGMAMDLDDTLDLAWSGDGVWELTRGGEFERVFTREPYSDMPETIVPMMPNGKDRRAALLAILAVVAP